MRIEIWLHSAPWNIVILSVVEEDLAFRQLVLFLGSVFTNYRPDPKLSLILLSLLPNFGASQNKILWSLVFGQLFFFQRFFI